MQTFGFIIILLSLVHFYRFGKAQQSSDASVRAKAGLWVFAGVMTILTGVSLMRVH